MKTRVAVRLNLFAQLPVDMGAANVRQQAALFAFDIGTLLPSILDIYPTLEPASASGSDGIKAGGGFEPGKASILRTLRVLRLVKLLRLARLLRALRMLVPLERDVPEKKPLGRVRKH